MTADETGPAAQRATGRGKNSSAKAYERRLRREGAVAAGRLTRTGSPIAAAMSRVPFVATIILLLAAGIVGVLWLNTMSDATGLQATASRIRQADIKTDIESLRKDVNTLKDPARLAAQAAQLGMVPAGDSALLQVGADGRGKVIGTPTPVAGAAVPTAATQAPAAAATPAAAKPTPAATTPAATTPAATAPAATTPAATAPAKTTAAKTTPTAAKATAATTVPAGSTPAKATPAKITPAKITPSTATPAKAPTASSTTAASKTTPAPRTTPARQTTTTGAGR